MAKAGRPGELNFAGNRAFFGRKPHMGLQSGETGWM
jgi:hypothetical protein